MFQAISIDYSVISDLVSPKRKKETGMATGALKSQLGSCLVRQKAQKIVADLGTHPRSSGEPSRTLSESRVCRPRFAPEHSKNVVRKRGNLFYLVYDIRWKNRTEYYVPENHTNTYQLHKIPIDS